MEEILKKTIKLYLGDHILDRVQKYGENAFSLEPEEKEITMIVRLSILQMVIFHHQDFNK